MARKVFISFLGTNNYVECNYYLEEDGNKNIKNVKYIQEALLKLHQTALGAEDICYFFLTKDAKRQNWENNQQYNPQSKKYNLPNEGLKSRLNKLSHSGFEAKIKDVEIPEGYSTNEIWIIFQKVFSKLERGDEIYLDITHAFRSIPMLGLVLLNYSKVVSKASVKGIYYGAFEKLGFANEVKKIPIDNRNAPILNLTSFSLLQDWSNAANDFIEFGNTQNLTKTLRKESNISDNLSKKQKGKLRNSLRTVAKGLNEFSNSIVTNRGNEIIKNDSITNLKREIHTLKPHLLNVPQLSPFSNILSVVEKEIEVFKDDDIDNGMRAISWCIKNKLIQQGITLLQEFMVTFCLKNIKLDYNNKTNRSTASGLLGKRREELFSYSNNKEIRQEQEIVVKRLEKESYFDDIMPIFNDITNNIRNDINHAGFGRKGRNAQEFEKALLKNFDKLCALLNFQN